MTDLRPRGGVAHASGSSERASAADVISTPKLNLE
jgi:hypothetical protein